LVHPVNDHRDDSLLDRAKRLFSSDDTHVTDASADAPAARGDEHGELAGKPHGPEQGHFVNDPPLEERPSLHPTSRDAGVSDAARAVGADADDPLEHAGVRQEGFTETGAASGKVAMRDGEEPVAGDEDLEDRGLGIG
jgi:hypothetical protein